MKMHVVALSSIVGLALTLSRGSLANPPAGGHETKSTPPASTSTTKSAPKSTSKSKATKPANPNAHGTETAATPATPANDGHADDHSTATGTTNPTPGTNTTPSTDTATADHNTSTANTAPGTDTAKPATHGDSHGPTADEALAMLKQGNENWVKNNSTDPNTEPARREDTATHGQKPFATILTCADSRLPVERIFDRGVGELFVLRVAGNVVNADNAGTIEYGTHHLHSGLLVVMGHSKCGAVSAAVTDAKVEGNIEKLVDKIEPAVERAEKDNPGKTSDELLPLAINENVWQSIFDLLRTSPETCKAVKNGELKIVGAVCNIETGQVEWLGEHPWQAEMVDAFIKRADETEHANADSDH